MNAESTVTTSAVVVGGIFAYRKLVGPVTGDPVAAQTAKQTGVAGAGKATVDTLTGATANVSTEQFVVGFAVVYITLAIVAQASPQLASSLAVLVAVGALLGNGAALFNHLQQRAAGPLPLKGHTGVSTTGPLPATIPGLGPALPAPSIPGRSAPAPGGAVPSQHTVYPAAL